MSVEEFRKDSALASIAFIRASVLLRGDDVYALANSLSKSELRAVVAHLSGVAAGLMEQRHNGSPADALAELDQWRSIGLL